MKRIPFITLTGLMLILMFSCRKETDLVMSKITFEDVALGDSGIWNGSDGSGGITVDNGFFKNYYDDTYKSWSGFAISNKTDKSTQGYVNQYSSIAGTGAAGSQKYAVLYSYNDDSIAFLSPQRITNISISLSTYGYLSMKNGDDFAKKFGGITGNDKDFFTVEFAAIDNEGQIRYFDTPVYLADFRFDDNTEDYIYDGWVNINLGAVGYVKYLVIHLDSSDKTGDLINTPTYLCIDNIQGEMPE